MAEIADCIIYDKFPLEEVGLIMANEQAKYQVGVKEIIGLYLLIPFMNNEKNRLMYDGIHTQVSIFQDDDIAFSDINGSEIIIKNLRDTMCHSFVSCEVPKEGGPYIVFNDRIIMSKSKHDKLAGTKDGNKCVLVNCGKVLKLLRHSYAKILSMR